MSFFISKTNLISGEEFQKVLISVEIVIKIEVAKIALGMPNDLCYILTISKRCVLYIDNEKRLHKILNNLLTNG